ncbi:hypothetical protein DMA15_03380 [Streptomyces sp. WAC 01529]|uniref:hypothetical protein n=1 Tax=Streptomyces sp. WAC 01529 TaxID=2203205 RepID=UPI000F6FAFB9|nr:hypothetical protein [Streptomyces sp. WAC 01529]AZM51736.1 hypothetical protein DMA15_03380 [Streptomyces sp. WAC 01529]
MNEDQARHLQRLLSLCGMPGVAAPVDDPAGEWRIYDEMSQQDITDVSRQRLAESAGRPPTGTAVRGFVVPDRA